MKLAIVKSVLKEGGRGVWRHPMITFASVTTIALMLISLAAFVVFSVNANSIVEKVGAEPPIQIWLHDGIEDKDIAAIDAAIKAYPGVVEYSQQSPLQNYEAYRQSLGENASILDSLKPEIMPYSFTVRLEEPGMVAAFKRVMDGYKGIDEVQYSQEVLDFLGNMAKGVNTTTLLASSVLLLISLLIISNMVRISILARAEEIQIMKYVGATNAYIRVPYLLEGAFTGVLGALLAWGLVMLAYSRLYAWAMQDTAINSMWALVPIKQVIWPLMLLLIAIGAVVGAIGSAISVRKHVNV